MCKTCEKSVNKENHLCYVPKYETKRKIDQRYLYVMCDLETMQNTLLNKFKSKGKADRFVHVPNLCVLQSVCTDCIDNGSDITIPCRTCGVREYIFNDTNCISNLLDYLVEKSNEKTAIMDKKGEEKEVNLFSQIIVLAHNMSGFDGQFILKYLYDSDRFKSPNIIMNVYRLFNIFSKKSSRSPRTFRFRR